MINLLPADIIRKNQADYRGRYLVVALYLLLALFIITILVGASTHWLLYQDYRGLAKQLSESEDKVAAREYDALSQALKHSQDQLTVLEVPKQSPLSPVALVNLLDRHRNPGVSIKSVSYAISESNVVDSNISGLASTRGALLDFLNALKAEPQLSTVVSPIDNLIKDRAVPFTIKIKTKPIDN